MSTLTLEERVAALEAEVASLRDRHTADSDPPASAQNEKKPWWQRRFGAFHNDSAYEEAMRLGSEYRRAQPTAADSDAEIPA